MKRIKLLYLIDQLNIGGTEKQLLAVLELLDRSRFDLYLICLRPTKYFEQCSVDCHKKVLNVTSLASLDGFKKLVGFVKFLKQEEIDIIQTFFFDSTVFGVLSASFARVKRILSSRRDMGFWYTPATLLTLFFINMLTHRVVVNSEAIKENVYSREHVKKEKIDVIYNGIDLEPFSVQYNVVALRKELGIPDEDQVVGIVANLNRRVKRVDLFIDAAAEVLKNQRKVSFIIIGEGGLRGELAKHVERLGICRKVYFIGSQTNVIPYLQLFDIGVMTSKSEGLSNAIIEYVASGLPVICFDVGGNREIVENGVNGWLIEDRISAELQEKIRMLLNNDNMRENMVGISQSLSFKYSWERKLSEYQNYYSQIVEIS